MKTHTPLVAACLLGLSSMSIACDTSDPSCIVDQYVEASINKDAGRVYELTAESERGDRATFLANYHDRHSVPQVFQRFWVESVEYESELISQQDGFARVHVSTRYPDWAGLALSRASEGFWLETPDQWRDLVDVMETQGVDVIEDEDVFYLLQTDGGWRILRPTLH